MLSRTTTSVVTFLHPFVVAGYADELPAGEYEVLADDEVMQSHSFVAYRRTATFLLINWHAGESDLRAVDHRDLELALAQDQANANTNVMKNSAAALSPSEDQK
ncbi:hypothetical protein TG4357_01867 [Thalassovita gelatinovora]|uniref:Uncharacterized protein n=2 Tax=Thalassovita gelatinovora TaxID=53501 RepID=A0A0P1FBK8_THAGE|nr:hypothetical protein HFZ77_05950 [Thalassovita gelatinovora]CUH65446.1 hypothetical protein TG4357_01867 [Thalassovita gelatinovora]SER09535.1 hypothetical protein SAMN04488043_11583 [Thalassovita gelatinovora]